MNRIKKHLLSYCKSLIILFGCMSPGTCFLTSNSTPVYRPILNNSLAYQKKIDELKIEIEQLKNIIQNLENEIKELKEENQRLKHTNQGQCNTIQTGDSTNKELKATIQKKEEESAKLKKELDNLKNEIIDLNDEKNKLRLIQIQAEEKEFKRNQGLQRKVELFKSRIISYKKTQEKQEEIIKEIQSAFRDLRSKTTELEEESKTKDNENQGLKQKIVEKDEKINELSHKIKKGEKKIARPGTIIKRKKKALKGKISLKKSLKEHFFGDQEASKQIAALENKYKKESENQIKKYCS